MKPDEEIKDAKGGAPDARREGPYRIVVSGKAAQFDDPVVDARKVLSETGYLPAKDHVLIQKHANGSSAVGLDEEVDLREPGREVFWAFLSDRVFNFTVQERGHAWGEGCIAEPDLRELADVPEDSVLVLERENEPDLVLGPTDHVDLTKRGVEDLRVRKRLVTVKYNHQPFQLAPGVYTGAKLKQIFAVEPGYVLDLIKDSGEFDELGDDEKVRIKDCMEFVSHAPCGQSA